MAKYAILIYGDEKAWANGGQPVMDETMKGHGEFAEKNGAAIQGGEALHGTETATSIRKTSTGEYAVTDGAFAETKEALGGFYLVDATDLDGAITLAKQIPAPFGGVEVRPVMVFN